MQYSPVPTHPPPPAMAALLSLLWIKNDVCLHDKFKTRGLVQPDGRSGPNRAWWRLLRRRQYSMMLKQHPEKREYAKLAGLQERPTVKIHYTSWWRSRGNGGPGRTFAAFFCFGPFLPFPVSDGVGGVGTGVNGEGGTETPATASNDMAASVLPGPAHCMPRTGEEDASSASEGLAPAKKGLLWAWRTAAWLRPRQTARIGRDQQSAVRYLSEQPCFDGDSSHVLFCSPGGCFPPIRHAI